MTRLLITLVAVGLMYAVGRGAADGWGTWILIPAIPAGVLVGLGAGYLADQVDLWREQR